MKRTRIAAVVLALVMSVGMIAGCATPVDGGGGIGREFLTWYYEEAPWRSPMNRTEPRDWITGFSEDPADRPSYADIEAIMDFANLAMSARGGTPWHVVVVTDYETQVLLNQFDAPGIPRAVSEGTVTFMIFSEWLLHDELRTDTYRNFFPREGYINAGILSAYINLGAIALGYSARQFMTLSAPWPPLGERWMDVEFLLEDRYYTWGATGIPFSVENMRFANAIVVGTLDPTLESSVTVAGRPANWSYWVPGEGTPGFTFGTPVVIDVAALADGVYTGSAQGYSGLIHVEVTVVGGVITQIDVVEHTETEAFFTAASLGVIPQILDAQTTRGVDTITGATEVSEGIINAVTDALLP